MKYIYIENLPLSQKIRNILNYGMYIKKKIVYLYIYITMSINNIK